MAEEGSKKWSVVDVVGPSSTPILVALKVSYEDGAKDVKSKVDVGTRGVKSKVDAGPSSTFKGFPSHVVRRKDLRQKAQGSVRNNVFFLL